MGDHKRREHAAGRPEVLATKQVADEYGLSEGTLRYWRHRDEGPASFRIGRRVLYRRSELESWISEQEAATRRGGGWRAA